MASSFCEKFEVKAAVDDLLNGKSSYRTDPITHLPSSTGGSVVGLLALNGTRSLVRPLVALNGSPVPSPPRSNKSFGVVSSQLYDSLDIEQYQRKGILHLHLVVYINMQLIYVIL